MADIVYDYSHAPTIKRFSESRSFIRGLMGPFGSGKSSGCAIQLVKWGAKQKLHDGKRRARFAVIRNTYPQLKDTTIKTVHQWLPPEEFGDWNKTDHVYTIDRLSPDLEVEILFRALDRPEQVANLLSLELTGAWINEAREVPAAVFRALQGRVGRYPSVAMGGCVDPGIIMDTNPPDDDSWWYKLFEEQRPDIAEVFKQPDGLSPEAENKPNLPTNYYENLLINGDDFVRVYVRGLYGYVREGKPVYPEYNDSLHCQPCSAVPGIVIRRGWDFGLTPACVFTQLMPTGRLQVIDELIGEDIGIEKFADAVLMHCQQKYPGYKFEDWADPAGIAKSQTDEKTCFAILHGKQIDVQAGEQTLALRLESVKLPLGGLVQGKPQLVLDPRCVKLRKGFQGRYQYRKRRISGTEERYQDEPDKNEYSHPHDALQYVCTKIFGDLVKSRQESPKRESRRAYGSSTSWMG